MNLEKTITVETGIEKADFLSNITAKYIMEILQKIATEHADEHNFGYKTLFPQGLAWVLNKIKLEFNRPIKVGEKISLTTWPLAPKHFSADRDFLAVDQNQEVIFKATSVWSLIDLNKRTLCSTDVIKNLNVSYHDKRAFERADFNRFKLDDSFINSYTKTIKISDLDVNNHVNNTNYLSYALDCLDIESYSKHIKCVEIRFSEELLFGDKIDLLYKKENQNHYVIGKKSTGEIAFYVFVSTGE